MQKGVSEKIFIIIAYISSASKKFKNQSAVDLYPKLKLKIPYIILLRTSAYNHVNSTRTKIEITTVSQFFVVTFL